MVVISKVSSLKMKHNTVNAFLNRKWQLLGLSKCAVNWVMTVYIHEKPKMVPKNRESLEPG